MSNDIKALVKSILTGEVLPDSVTQEELEMVEATIKLMKSKVEDIDKNGKEVVKYDNNGQWKIEKAIKEGPTLDYAKMNAVPKADESKARTLNYKEINDPKNQSSAWSKQSTNASKMEVWSKMNRLKRDRVNAQVRSGVKMDKNEVMGYDGVGQPGETDM